VPVIEKEWVRSAYGHGLQLHRGDEYDTYKLPNGVTFQIPNDTSWKEQEALLKAICKEYGIELE